MLNLKVKSINAHQPCISWSVLSNIKHLLRSTVGQTLTQVIPSLDGGGHFGSPRSQNCSATVYLWLRCGWDLKASAGAERICSGPPPTLEGALEHDGTGGWKECLRNWLRNPRWPWIYVDPGSGPLSLWVNYNNGLPLIMGGGGALACGFISISTGNEILYLSSECVEDLTATASYNFLRCSEIEGLKAGACARSAWISCW